jgi:hypothetical protein
MVHDQRIGRLLRHEHKVLAEHNADVLRCEQFKDFGALFKIGTGWIAETVSAAPVSLPEELGGFRRIFA